MLVPPHKRCKVVGTEKLQAAIYRTVSIAAVQPGSRALPQRERWFPPAHRCSPPRSRCRVGRARRERRCVERAGPGGLRGAGGRQGAAGAGPAAPLPLRARRAGARGEAPSAPGTCLGSCGAPGSALRHSRRRGRRLPCAAGRAGVSPLAPAARRAPRRGGTGRDVRREGRRRGAER